MDSLALASGGETMASLLETPLSEAGSFDILSLISTASPGAVNFFTETVLKQLDRFESVEARIAVTGESVGGRSSFIDAIRNVPDNEAGACPAGGSVTEPTNYKFPSTNALQIWDLPAIGSPDFSAAEYLDHVAFHRFDAFLILSSDRFTENELLLAKAIQKRQKNVYLVRMESASDPLLPGGEQREASPNDGLKEQLPKVFLVTSWRPGSLGFEELLLDLAQDLSELKKRAFLFAVPCVTSKIEQAKKELMMNEIWKVAARPILVNMMPIPVLSDMCGMTQLVATLTSYRKAFGLDEDSRGRWAKRVGRKPEEFSSAVTSTFGLAVCVSAVKKQIAKAAQSGRILATLLNVVPVVGQMGSATLSYRHTLSMLEAAVGEMAQDSERLLQKVLPLK
ncbi:interferon-inducible GTPase 5-like [Stegostoma tigrinum]|uniref:interferon-inducible GTPase 5-like n=1 Tax=Stegostoma tigrinum TaxID=3053191 RepID=UPI0028707980|nr:interferon-inducible GTPase 5-like [Stegostoma tigrinum]